MVEIEKKVSHVVHSSISSWFNKDTVACVPSWCFPLVFLAGVPRLCWEAWPQTCTPFENIVP